MRRGQRSALSLPNAGTYPFGCLYCGRRYPINDNVTPPLPRLPCRYFVALLCFFHVTSPAAPDWTAVSWKSDDGLPNNHVTGLTLTPDGYLWVATFSRPARFDGVRFEPYVLRDFNVPANQKITAIQNGNGGLWLGTSHGHLLFFNAKSVRVFTNQLPDKVIQTLTVDREGAVWATYQGGLVRRIRNGVVTVFTARDGLPVADKPDNYVCSLACDQQGGMWFAKNGQVGVYRDGRFQTLLSLPTGTARLAGAAGGGVWIFSHDKLMRFVEGKPLETIGSFSNADAEPTVVFEDRRGRVWLGTQNNGLFHYDGLRFEKVPVSDQWITSLAEDREGNLWAGTESGGLDRVCPRGIGLETAGTGLPSGTVQSICETADGSVWAATQNGLLLRKKDGVWDTISTNADWPGGRATCVTTDRNGAVWIATRDHALHCWRDGRFTTIGRAEGLAGREIHALLSDDNGDLWIGEESPDVVQRLRDGKLDTFAMPANVRIIRAMARDTNDNIWIGSSGGLLVRIHDDVVTDETAHTTGTPLSIRCLHMTADNGLWIGFADEGAGWFKDGHFCHLDAAHDFPEENVSQIIDDRDGWLWFGGDHGIFKARRSELEKLAVDPAANVNYVRYGQSEGLFSLEANCGDSPGAMRGQDGRLWIPMRGALAIVDPKRLPEDTRPVPVLLKRVTVDDDVIASYGGNTPVRNGIDLNENRAGWRLLPGYHRLKFDFTALSYTAPENVRFRYKLEGFDSDWNDAGAQRSVNYSRLAAGNYLFRVMACNGSGVWNTRGTAFAFTVAPFFWRTWWFDLAALVVFTTLVVATVRYISFRRLRARLRRLEQQAALDKERARIARDIHDDIGGRLTEVELLIESANRTPRERWNGQMHRISATVRQMGESLDEIVWAVNPRHDTLPHLMDYLGQYAIQFCRTAGIRCRVDFPDDLPSQAIPPETRHHLFLAIKEALNNVVRHAHATEVWLRVTIEQDRLRLVVEDNGRGFDGASDHFTADGLLNMRRRMEELAGDFRIESRPDDGTRILFTLPLSPAGRPLTPNTL